LGKKSAGRLNNTLSCFPLASLLGYLSPVPHNYAEEGLQLLADLKLKMDKCISTGDFLTARKLAATIEELATETWGQDSWQRGLALLPIARFYEATNPGLFIPTLEEYVLKKLPKF
jgi:hypothetical protein